MTKGIASRTGNALTADTAKGLAVLPGVLHLSYKSLSPAAARALSNFQGERIELDEFPRMDEQSARMFLRLAETGRLSIAWLRAKTLLRRINRSTILELARYAESVDLDGMPDLTAREAHFLADFEGVQILLYLERLDKKTAANLAKARPELLHATVIHATDAALIVLASSNASDELQICLENGSLSLTAAAALADYRGNTLGVIMRSTHTENIMREIVRFHGHLYLHIPIISQSVAKILADSDGTLELHYNESTSHNVELILSKSNREITNLDELLE